MNPMPVDETLKNLVDEFLYLIEVGSGSNEPEESNAAELAHLLDRLALAVRCLVVPDEPEAIPEVPPRNVEILRKVAASRFPNYGRYHRPQQLVAGAEPTKLEIASAIDAVATIADHLHAVSWLWRNATYEHGLWYLAASHRHSWGLPMRELQLYLDTRAVEYS
jgi:hypothetical protein